MKPIVTIAVGGQKFSEWTAVEVRASFGTEATPEFAFTASEMDSIAPKFSTWRIMPGDACEVLLDGELVITGSVDTRQAGYDAASHALQIQGRGALAALVDSSVDVPGGQFKEYTLEAIARAVAAPFGITVRKDAQGQDRPFHDVQIFQDETVWEFLGRLARIAGYLITEAPSGELLITRASLDRTPAAMLIEGENILAASAVLRADTAPSQVTVLGQCYSLGEDDWDPARTTRVFATVLNAAFGRYRPVKLIAEEPVTAEDCVARAQAEVARGIAEGVECSVRVAGWRRDDGKFWKPGDVAHVRSPMLLLDRPLVVRDIVWSQSEAGTTTELTLCPPEVLSAPSEGDKLVGQEVQLGSGEVEQSPVWDPPIPAVQAQGYDHR